MRITGDNEEGKAELDNFIHPEEKYPVIATTSKLMSTGVDAQTCKVIVLDQTIRSMTEFKQIVGRGTRIREDQGKLYFTILDFKRATELFADPDFDGLPVRVYEPGADDPAAPPDDDDADADADASGDGQPQGQHEGLDPRSPREAEGGDDFVRSEHGGLPGRRTKYVVGDVPVYVLNERVQYYGGDGRLITESLRDYSKKAVVKDYKSLDEFLQRWKAADRKKAVVDELMERGVFFDDLAEEVGRECSPFDLVCHVAYGQPPLTRKERANNVRKRNYFTKYGEQARAVLEALLAKFADEGVEDIADIAVLRVAPLTKLGTPIEILKAFGGKEGYMQAVHDLEAELYRASS
jgi:type I restriction enzyme R subunit